jgi:SAM-dependent methyltransferase
VLEVGAGHGSFTTTIRSTHARVTVTEMSKPSADYLQQRYAGDPGVEVVYDPDGRWIFETDRTFDAVVCISVLHHIPDYLAAIQRYTELTRPGGTFISWEDPIWYARLPPRQRRAAQAAYYSWRVVRTPWRQGAGTLLRRVRGFVASGKRTQP